MRKFRGCETLTLCQLECPTALVHFVLLDHPTFQMMDRTLRIHLFDQTVGPVRPLGPFEDVEVVVGGMAAGVPFGPERGPKDDEVLGDRRMEDVHASHRSASIVEDPFRRQRRYLVGVSVLEGLFWGRMERERVGSDGGAVGALQRRGNVVHDSCGGVGIEGDGLLRESMNLCRVEDVPSLLLDSAERQLGAQM